MCIRDRTKTRQTRCCPIKFHQRAVFKSFDKEKFASFIIIRFKKIERKTIGNKKVTAENEFLGSVT